MKTEKLFLEIIDGEGGEDAKLLINEMCDIYIKNARTHKHTIELIETRDGYTSF